MEKNWVRSGTINNWVILNGKTLKAQINGYAVFGGEKYDNELFSFTVRMDPSTGGGSWPAIVLRAQEPANYTETDCYIFCFGQEGIELHRYIRGTRHQIYGEVLSNGVNNQAKQGGKITDSPWNLKGFHDVTIGAIADGEDVRILLIIDGETVIDYLDLGAHKALSKTGHFGFIGRGETFTFRKDTQIEDDLDEAYAPVAVVEAQSAYTQESAAVVTITTDGALWDLKELQLNGKRVPDTAYTAAEGGTDGISAVITVSDQYLDTLTPGTYTLKAIFAGDRSVESALEISAKPTYGIVLAVAIAVVVAILAVILLRRTKKGKKS